MTQNSVFDFDGLPTVGESTAPELEKHQSPWEEFPLQQYENDTSDEAAQSVSSKKRKCQSVSGTKAAATLPKNHQYFPNNLKQKKKNEREDKLSVHIEAKSVLKVTKILKDRVLRRKNNEKGNDLQNAVIKQYPEIAISLQEIQKTWAPLSNLQNISEKISEIEQEVKDAGIGDMKATEEMKPRLLEIGKAIEKFDEECKMHSGKVKSIEQYFCKGVGMDTLKEKLYSAYPEYAPEELAWSTANQDQESLQTDTGATSTPLKEKLKSAVIPAVQTPSKKKKTSHQTSPKALDFPPCTKTPPFAFMVPLFTEPSFDQDAPIAGEYVPPQGFSAHNDFQEKETPMNGTAQATASSGAFVVQDVDTHYASFPSDLYATHPTPLPDDPNFLSNAKYGMGALLSTVPVEIMDNMKKVLFEMMKPEILLACQAQMFSLDARLQMLEGKAETNSIKWSEVEVAQNKVKMLEIEKTDLMIQLNHADKKIRDLEKRLEASGASSSQAPTWSFGT